MKMLKKFAVVLLLSGSCGLQAMHGVGQPEIGWVYRQKNPRMHGHSAARHFERSNMTPEQIAAENAKMDLYKHRREFEEAHVLRFPEKYNRVEDSNLGMYGPVPDHYVIKPEYKQDFEAELAAIK